MNLMSWKKEIRRYHFVPRCPHTEMCCSAIKSWPKQIHWLSCALDFNKLMLHLGGYSPWLKKSEQHEQLQHGIMAPDWLVNDDDVVYVRFMTFDWIWSPTRGAAHCFPTGPNMASHPIILHELISLVFYKLLSFHLWPMPFLLIFALILCSSL